MEQNKAKSWVSVIAFVVFLIGVYGSLRVIINLVAFDKYPFGGVLPSIPIKFGYDTGVQNQYGFTREQDCPSITNIYYAQDNITPRPATEEELKRDTEYRNNCIESVKENRNAQKINDMSQSLLWLFIGGGILLYQRRVSKI